MIRRLLAIAVCCAPAQAAAELIVEGPSRIVGDGKTAVVFKVSSDSVDDGELTATPSAGVVRRVRKTGDGFEVELLPPRVVEELEVRIMLSLRGTEGSETRAHAIIVTATEAPTQLRSSGGPFDLRGPDRVFLGGTDSVRFSIAIGNHKRPPVLVASVGQLGALEPAGNGRLAVSWSPPVEAYPQVLFVVALSADSAEIGTMLVPLYGRGRVRLESEPNASVTVRVGETEFGPVTTDAEGRAELAVTAPPGVDVANTVARDRLGNETLGSLRLGAPAFSRVFAACPLAGDSIVVLAATKTGERAASAEFDVRASSGRLGSIEVLAPGVFAAKLSSVADSDDLELSATLRDQPGTVSRCRPPETPRLFVVKGQYMLVVRGGYVSNLGRINGPVLATEVSYRFPLPYVTFSLGVHAEIIFGFDSTESAGMNPETIRTQVIAAPIMAQFSIGIPLGKVTPYISGGAGIVIARATVSSRSADIRRSATRPAARGALGISAPLGPGSIVGEAAYLHATLDEPEIQGRIGGVQLVAGYGWSF